MCKWQNGSSKRRARSKSRDVLQFFDLLSCNVSLTTIATTIILAAIIICATHLLYAYQRANTVQIKLDLPLLHRTKVLIVIFTEVKRSLRG